MSFIQTSFQTVHHFCYRYTVEINLTWRTFCVRFVVAKVALKQGNNRWLFWKSYGIHKCTLGRMQNLLMLQHMVLVFTVGFQALNYASRKVQLEYVCTPDTFRFYSHLQGEDILAVSRRKKIIEIFWNWQSEVAIKVCT